MIHVLNTWKLIMNEEKGTVQKERILRYLSDENMNLRDAIIEDDDEAIRSLIIGQILFLTLLLHKYHK